ncbi:glucoamylase family protein [Enterococcus sp. N249-2]
MIKEDIVALEARKSFDFFWKEANTNPSSPGYGLIKDNTEKGMEAMASIASVGFGLSAIVIAVERGWITRDQGAERTLGTLKTFRDQVESYHGFFYHFIDMETGKKYGENYDCPSIIDTAIFINGAITSGMYFGGEILAIAQILYEKVEWPLYYDDLRNVFFMGYHPGEGGFGQWDMYAEQLMMYLLAVGSPTYPVPAKIYDGFDRTEVSYGNKQFYTSPGNPLFTHQYSHAWFDFSQYLDKDGIDWAENSRLATLAQRQYAIDFSRQFKTFHEKSWGLTACAGPKGYRVYGAAPSDCEENDGTVAPTAASGSIVFTPVESIEVMHYLHKEQPQIWGEYGFKDAYNLDLDPPYYAEGVIGIDKGITLLMIDNFLYGTTWRYYMQYPHVRNAIEILGFMKKS